MSTPAEPNEWNQRAMRWWHLAFAAAPVCTAAFVVALHDDTDSVGVAVLALLSMTVLWFAFGRRSFDSPAVRTVFQACLVLALGLGIAAAPNVATIQCLVFPFFWVSIPSIRGALIGNGVIALSVFLGFSWALRGSSYGVAAAIAIPLASVVFSIAMGLWITRIAHWGHERALLLADLTSAQAQLATVSREQGMASERERMARELHDTIAQSLTGLVMVAQRVAAAETLDPALRTDVELIESIGRDTLGETRALVAASASVQVEGGLAAAAERLAARYRRETGIALDVQVQAVVPRELEVVVLRCMQEALANIRKHAQAARATVRIQADGRLLTLEVTDDGVGIDPAAADSGAGFGLSGMRERLALVGGELSTAPGVRGGTILRASMPLTSDAESLDKGAAAPDEPTVAASTAAESTAGIRA